MRSFYAILILALAFLTGCQNVAQNVEMVTEAIEHNKEVEARKAREKKKNKEPLDTNLKVYNKDSKTTSEVKIVDGKKEGTARQYYPNGKLWKEVNYRTGELHGTAKVYFRDGSIKRTVEYLDGKKHGDYIRYFKSGKKKTEARYENDLPMPGYVDRGYRGEEKEPPVINVSEENLLAQKGRYIFHFKLEPAARETEFYLLRERNEWSGNNPVLKQFKLPKNDQGEAYLPLELEPGYAMEEDMIVFAHFKTRSGFEAVVSKDLPIRVRRGR